MGLLPRPRIDGKLVQFKYKSPLALAKGQQEIARFTQWFQLMQGMFGPDRAQLYVNPQVAPWVLAEQMQVDSRYLNTPDGVQQAAQQMQNAADDSPDVGDEPAAPPQEIEQ